MRACWAWILVGLLASVAPAQTVLHAFTGSGSGQFGRVVAGAGDVDADGSPDVAIAAPTEDAPGGSMPSVGSVTVFSGASGAPLFLVRGAYPCERLGWDVDGIGDVTGDGHDDLVVGSLPQDCYPLSGGPVGGAYVVSGASGSIVASFLGATGFGITVRGAGDVDVDGTPDLVVGAPSAQLDLNADAAFVYSGSTGALLFLLSDPSAPPGFPWHASFGASVAAAGDLDQDGHADLLVGEPALARVWTFSGATGAPLGKVDGAAGSGLGATVASAMLDLDSIPDTLTGTPASTFGFSGASGAGLGSVAGTLGDRVPDLDLDGRDDVAVATPAGVEVRAAGNGALVVALAGAGPAARFAGDVNGDGFADLAVGDGAGHASLVSLLPNGLEPFGTGTASCAGPQTLTGNQAPNVGSATFEVRGDHAPASSSGVLVLASVADLAGTDVLHLGVLLHVDLSAPFTFGLDAPSDSGGHTAVALPLPALPSLAGKSVFAQAFFPWPSPCGSPVSGLASSRGLRIDVQP